MSINKEIGGEILRSVEHALKKSSKIPYNNATSVYEAARLSPDIRMGGSCLLKLNELENGLPKSLEDKTRFVTSQVGDTTHYAMVIDINGKDYYLDPFLWQKEPISLSDDGKTRFDTLEDIWTINREPDEDGALFVMSFRELAAEKEERTLVTHRFTNELDYLPSSSALPLRPNLPSFTMQIPDSENQKLYKVWYLKEPKRLGDLWVVDGVTGRKDQVHHKASHVELRSQVLAEIERLTGSSESQLIEFFSTAHDIEIELAKSLSSDPDAPLH